MSCARACVRRAYPFAFMRARTQAHIRTSAPPSESARISLWINDGLILFVLLWINDGLILFVLLWINDAGHRAKVRAYALWVAWVGWVQGHRAVASSHDVLELHVSVDYAVGMEGYQRS